MTAAVEGSPPLRMTRASCARPATSASLRRTCTRCSSRRHASAWVRVRSPQLPALIETLERRGAKVERVDGADGIDVFDLAIEQVGEAAAAAQITLHELATKTESLEDAFLSATADSQEYRSGGPA